MKTKLALLVLAWSLTASADERKTLDLSSIASSAPFPVHGDAGLAGLHEHAKVPADWADRDILSSCSRERHASIVRPDDTTFEIVSANGRDYLDSGSFQTDQGTFEVVTHDRREVTRVATIGDASVWAYRDHGALHLGAFGDFGEDFRYVSFGCRWREVIVFERGGTASFSSDPSMSDAPADLLTQPEPKATGPTFSFSVSVSRSASDPTPLVVLRTKT